MSMGATSAKDTSTKDTPTKAGHMTAIATAMKIFPVDSAQQEFPESHRLERARLGQDFREQDVPERVSSEQDSAERGSTVVGAAVVSVLIMLLIVIAALMSAAFMASRAATAADLAALGAADAYRGITEGDPCAIAGEVATANGASLTACELEGTDKVRVYTEVRAPGWLSWVPWPGRGKARAGPPSSTGAAKDR